MRARASAAPPPPRRRATAASAASCARSLVTGVGFIVLGLMGFAIKLVHIPINNLLVGG